jgi:hypothetical protein
MVHNEGEFTERHVYDRSFRRVSTSFAYAEDTSRGEPGESIADDTAVNHTEKLIRQFSSSDPKLRYWMRYVSF